MLSEIAMILGIIMGICALIAGSIKAGKLFIKSRDLMDLTRSLAVLALILLIWGILLSKIGL